MLIMQSPVPHCEHLLHGRRIGGTTRKLQAELSRSWLQKAYRHENKGIIAKHLKKVFIVASLLLFSRIICSLAGKPIRCNPRVVIYSTGAICLHEQFSFRQDVKRGFCLSPACLEGPHGACCRLAAPVSNHLALKSSDDTCLTTLFKMELPSLPSTPYLLFPVHFSLQHLSHSTAL